jgi:hypothetical protein
LTPPAAGAVFLAALFAKCFLGALVPVFFLAVYFVLAILVLVLLRKVEIFVIIIWPEEVPYIQNGFTDC